ncbi:MAG: RNA methyltransferase [Capnocytophaga sp.]|jgi:tRNA/rRNA methyltransferase|uniref:tRNA (guanosine(18)-2'-O)-methyltransferase n=2 Tax=Capnocytophaga ochracea TaxID=1018 RepID=C7M6U7_CAPOD|nr:MULTISPECIES: RNA methyltransferase [Capnocytophaga]ACU93073.1 tRNA/rRNA methyltransferase (SpoU) [Capnocytophaga ochracea DSM 7271]ALC96154.1 rRNA methyltransferase [Capnocytophaga sp. oral taxon 323]EKY05668.1 RNA methyltransferase, TrmH family [Capnocytophaga sp. oral taxon 380 str. F0488]MDU6659160.1 RNA methyltransferase [Capnocytophaga sp.]UAK51773.1 RNA methyltransferase [Capnocytophaga ochracea]
MNQELLTYLEHFITEERKERFLQVISARTNHFTVAMEDVFQMHNTSAVVRTCEVFGVQQAHSIEGRFGKRLDAKIAMGAQKWVDVFRYNDTQSCIDALRAQGYQIVATTPHKDAYFLNDFDISKKSAFFFGTEKEGLSEQVLSQADTYLKIPMVGFTESLNISVAVAIVLQQLTDKLRRSQVAWQLTDEERLSTLINWTKKSIRNVKDVLKRYEELTAQK